MIKLLLKYKDYLRWIYNSQDHNGFIESQDCDSLLFSGLIGCVPGIKVNINAAQDSTGRWLRRPTDLPACYDCTNTWSLKDKLRLLYRYFRANGWNKQVVVDIFDKGGSSISRDMLIGLAWYAYFNKRLDISESVIKYAFKNKGLMGEGSPSRTFLTPGLLSTYAWISYRLGGPSRLLLRYIPQLESKSVVGFEAHLSVLHILLRNKLTGKKKNTDILTMHAERQPNNALFQFAADRKDEAYSILADTKWFPEDRLPTSADRSEQWLWQRDYGYDWLPDDKNKQHSGADFLFCYWLINNYNEE